MGKNFTDRSFNGVRFLVVSFSTSHFVLVSEASFPIPIKFTQEALRKANSSQTVFGQSPKPLIIHR